MTRFWLLVAFLSTAVVARHPALHPFIFGRPVDRGFVGHGEHVAGISHSDYENLDAQVQKFNFSQKVDNFDVNNNAVYNQRYWYNPTYSQKKNIIFLMIQGESPATDLWITNGGYQYLQWAKMFGADAFQLEHRCFGYSRPYPDTSFKNIKVCTMEQALADIHNFINAMNKKYNFQNPKWVTFGGSYPGALSALFRATYPQDTVGAVASSAPMLWTLDFFQYTQVMEDVITQTDPNCRDQVALAFSTMQTLTLNGQITKLNSYFQLDPPFVNGNYTQKDIDNFFSNVVGYFQGVIQYTYDGRNDATKNGLNVKNLCQIMTDNKKIPDVVSRVKAVIDWINKMNGDPVGPFANSYSDMIKALVNGTYDDENFQQNAAARGWMWLCCNELGVLQTTDQGRNIFQQTIPLNYYIDMCTDMFDPSVDIKYIRDRNLRTLNTFGGNANYKATNVVLPNGSYDPWHVLGTNATDSVNHVTPLLIQGAAHCSDMYPTYPNEPAALASNRAIIQNQLQYFLGIN
ncbi:unnamed protein product [Caenorhabditis auriculariae]|uniref:Uncharacterized protein n=1 Tax=Caenorhabditis auriculariae TaxID=2777116 RepID=A0A8S1GPF9_9PELO|nr:unnamed protein product [Caenorhabditis auriculariae]